MFALRIVLVVMVMIMVMTMRQVTLMMLSTVTAKSNHPSESSVMILMIAECLASWMMTAKCHAG